MNSIYIPYRVYQQFYAELGVSDVTQAITITGFTSQFQAAFKKSKAYEAYIKEFHGEGIKITGCTKLCKSQMHIVEELLKTKKQHEVAMMYGVTASTVSKYYLKYIKKS